MIKRVIKFSLGTLGMVLAGFAALYTLHFFSPEYRQEQAARDLVQKEEEMKQAIYADMYGGDSPEETLDLYKDAIQKRDIDLAVKYYVLPQQEKARKELSDLTDEQINNIVDYVTAAKNGKLKIEFEVATFSFMERVDDGYIIVGDQKISVPPGESTETIQLGRNPNHKWKILWL